MDAALAIADRPTPPDPAPDRRAPAAGTEAPKRITQLLILIRWIIGYGTDLAATIQQRAARPDFESFAHRFRKPDLAVIIARIKRGLLLAAGVEAKYAKRAAKGGDVRAASLPTVSARAAHGAAPKQPRAPRRTNIIDLPLDRLPTAEEIADELRRRPVGAVLVDICRELGIRPGDLPRDLWPVLRDLVIQCGGQLTNLLWGERDAASRDQEAAAQQPASSLQAAQQPAPSVQATDAAQPVLSTGPP